MPSAPNHDERPTPLVAWSLLAGGAAFLAGGPMHPKQDPPDVTVREHLRVMYEDPSWVPSHAALLVGMVLLAVALVALARDRALAAAPRVHAAACVAAATTSLAAVAMLVHLVAGSEADAIAAGKASPITDLQLVTETLAVPAFGLSIAVLAVLGARTGTLGSPLVAIPAVVGGVGYALAGATFLVSDRLDALFPAASGIALWALLVGASLVRRRRAAAPAAVPA